MRFLFNLLRNASSRSAGENRKRRIIVVGDSHVAAMQLALDFAADDVPFQAVELFRLNKRKDAGGVGDITFEKFLHEAKTLSEEDFVFSSISGNQYAILSTVRHPIEFDFAQSAEDVVEPGLTQIPSRAIDSMFDRALETAIGQPLQQLLATTCATVVHISPPPPKSDNKHILRRYEKKFAEMGIDQLGPSRPELRLKAWKSQQIAIARLCTKLGISTLPPPKSAVDEQGYLHPGYYGKDATHANRRYGRDVLLQILDLVGRHDKTEASVAV